ncbi:MAG: 4-deoxy-4-formamido-L-arabinose-phosphoundecaprenol deformylase, partial [Gammaproteobacteria bacterium]
ALPDGHVYTLHAELEGMALSPVMQRLLAGWQAAGDTLGTLRDTSATLDRAAIPTRSVRGGEVPGRSGVLAVQGPARG